jgi:hypothetical protein
MFANGLVTDDMTAPLFPAVKYELVKFDLTPIPKTRGSPYIGYGPDVDKAWDYIANDSKLPDVKATVDAHS